MIWSDYHAYKNFPDHSTNTSYYKLQLCVTALRTIVIVSREIAYRNCTNKFENIVTLWQRVKGADDWKSAIMKNRCDHVAYLKEVLKVRKSADRWHSRLWELYESVITFRISTSHTCLDLPIKFGHKWFYVGKTILFLSPLTSAKICHTDPLIRKISRTSSVHKKKVQK